MENTNVNDPNFDKLKPENLPDIVIVKKVYADQKQKRRWKLRHFLPTNDTESVTRDYEDFLQDLEQDPAYREEVNIYRDSKVTVVKEDVTTDDEDGDRPRISLEEMLDDLNLTDLDEQGDFNVADADSE